MLRNTFSTTSQRALVINPTRKPFVTRKAAAYSTCEARHSMLRNTFSATSQRGRQRRHLPPAGGAQPGTPCSQRSRPATAGSCIHFSSLQ